MNFGVSVFFFVLLPMINSILNPAKVIVHSHRYLRPNFRLKLRICANLQPLGPLEDKRLQVMAFYLAHLEISGVDLTVHVPVLFPFLNVFFREILVEMSQVVRIVVVFLGGSKTLLVFKINNIFVVVIYLELHFFVDHLVAYGDFELSQLFDNFHNI